MVKKSKKSDEAEVLKPVTIKAEVKAKPKARKKKVKILDPIGDLSDGEAQVAVEPAVEPPVEATAQNRSQMPKLQALKTSSMTKACLNSSPGPRPSSNVCRRFLPRPVLPADAKLKR